MAQIAASLPFPPRAGAEHSGDAAAGELGAEESCFSQLLNYKPEKHLLFSFLFFSSKVISQT